MTSQFIPFPLRDFHLEIMMLPLILNSPRGSFPPTVIKNGGPGPRPPFMHTSAWASFHFELWEGQSVSEVFARVQGVASPDGGCRGEAPRGAAPPCLRKFCIRWA